MAFTRKQAIALGLGKYLEGEAPSKPGRRAHTPGVMNQTETRYANEVLMPLKLAGEIKDFGFESETLQLGPEMTFTPDFVVIGLDDIKTYKDIKGAHIWEDSKVKAKAAAVLYPHHRFEQVQWREGRWVKKRWVPAHWKTRVFRGK